jgi:hypothetical protein
LTQQVGHLPSMHEALGFIQYFKTQANNNNKNYEEEIIKENYPELWTQTYLIIPTAK